MYKSDCDLVGLMLRYPTLTDEELQQKLQLLRLQRDARLRDNGVRFLRVVCREPALAILGSEE